MKYTPYTEAQIQSMNVMDEGVYDFEVMDVILTDKNNNPLRDKNGNDLAKLKLMIWDNQNRERIVYTFISGDGNFAYKLRHYAKSIGMITDYENGTFDIERTVNKSGKAEVVIKKGTIKADGSGEMWPDRNDIKDFGVSERAKQTNDLYVAPNSSPNTVPPVLQVPQSQELDDDVPF